MGRLVGARSIRHILLFGPPMAFLAACSDGTAIRPGNWETTISMADDQSELWRSTITRCINPSEAADPGVGILAGSQLGQCQATESEFSGGRIAVRATCPGRGSAMASVPMVPGMMASRVSVDGTYNATAMEGRLVAELEEVIESIRLNGTLTARRIGDCST